LQWAVASLRRASCDVTGLTHPGLAVLRLSLAGQPRFVTKGLLGPWVLFFSSAAPERLPSWSRCSTWPRGWVPAAGHRGGSGVCWAVLLPAEM